ncbi:MAG: hypothetical protein CENE_01011 [Candidatus Celerinatantimonas neptuna]|nr:MAG: hypothetical protein CENE_01011 [Candidatus Celerinatantimonas neptuna]
MVFLNRKNFTIICIENTNSELIGETSSIIISLLKKYDNSFIYDKNFFYEKINDLLNNNIKNIHIVYLSYLFDFIDKINLKTNKDYYINRYKEENPKLHISENEITYFNMKIKNKDIYKLFEYYLNNRHEFNLYDTISSLSQNMPIKYWELETLSNVSVDDLIDWIKIEKSNIKIEISNGLFIFRKENKKSIENAELYQKIENNTITALKIIASENEFNRRRINEFFNIELVPNYPTVPLLTLNS